MRIKGLTENIIKDSITEALFILMRKQAYARISIGEITDKAGVNRSSYYRHFTGKEDIIRYYLRSIMQEYQANYRKAPVQNFHTYTFSIFSTFYEHKNELLLLDAQGLSHLLLDVLYEVFQFNETAKKADKKKAYELSYHIGGIYSNMLFWLSHDMDESPEEMTEIALSFKPEGSFTLLDVHGSGR